MKVIIFSTDNWSKGRRNRSPIKNSTSPSDFGNPSILYFFKKCSNILLDHGWASWIQVNVKLKALEPVQLIYKTQKISTW